MPEIGEVKNAREIGKIGHQPYIFSSCADCGLLRWVRFKKGKAVSSKCRSCMAKGRNIRGVESPNWKGGRIISSGYIYIRLQPDDFFYPMTLRSYVAEHRLVVAKALNRCLLPWEIIHHKGKKYPSGSKENRSDNRYPENLQLLDDKKYHLVDSLVKTHIKKQTKQITELQARVTLLEAELVLHKNNEPIIATRAR